MAAVWVPALLRELTGGQSVIEVPAGTVLEAIEQIEERYPGVKARLVEEGRLRPGIVVVVDGVTSARKLRQKLNENSEVHFLPAIGGG